MEKRGASAASAAHPRSAAAPGRRHPLSGGARRIGDIQDWAPEPQPASMSIDDGCLWILSVDVMVDAVKGDLTTPGVMRPALVRDLTAPGHRVWGRRVEERKVRPFFAERGRVDPQGRLGMA